MGRLDLQESYVRAQKDSYFIFATGIWLGVSIISLFFYEKTRISPVHSTLLGFILAVGYYSVRKAILFRRLNKLERRPHEKGK